MSDAAVLQPPIRAVALPLFPVMGSLREVQEYAESRLPIVDKNELIALLGAYHNTLIKQLEN